MSSRQTSEPFRERGFSESPGSVLESLFGHIYQARMQGLPVINPSLSVEAVGFIRWEGHWLGVLISPWFINLLLVPGANSPWPVLEPGKGNELVISFPQGNYRFSPRYEEGLGSYLCCSLASPVHEWPSQAAARQTAEDVMRLIQTLPVTQLDSAAPAAAAGGCSAGQQAAPCNPSRRSFLGGGLIGAHSGEPRG